MNTYIALFRGINVGGKNVITMKELVAILAKEGFDNIATYIQSGNVVFQTHNPLGSAAADEISRAIATEKGFTPHVLLLSVKALNDAVAANPYPADVGKALHFYFLEAKPKHPDLEQLKALKTESEAFALVNNVFYLYAPQGIGRSKLAAKVEKNIGVPATARNYNTVNKILAMIDKTSQC